MDAELDPLTEYGEDGIDVTLIRWMLSLTPVERLRVLQERANSVIRFRQRNGIPARVNEDGEE